MPTPDKMTVKACDPAEGDATGAAMETTPPVHVALADHENRRCSGAIPATSSRPRT
jgi:hypothetical protein